MCSLDRFRLAEFRSVESDRGFRLVISDEVLDRLEQTNVYHVGLEMFWVRTSTRAAGDFILPYVIELQCHELREVNRHEVLGYIGGGPRCQETMEDTFAQIRFENVTKHSNNSLLGREEQQELTDKEKDTYFMQFLEKRREFFAAKREKDKRNMPPTQAQKRKIMCTYLKNMEGYTLKKLKEFEFDKVQEIFDKAFKRVNTFEDYRTELMQGQKRKKEQEKS
nr:hypothetical protein [Tanacetum cinerariifolium]